MPTSLGPFRVMLRRDGVYIVVSADDHTVCEVRRCDDGTHPGRELNDATMIATALNELQFPHDKTPQQGSLGGLGGPATGRTEPIES